VKAWRRIGCQVVGRKRALMGGSNEKAASEVFLP
jgi:hypothetical protein